MSFTPNHMARKSPKSPVPVVCEKNHSGCMYKWGLYRLFEFRQGHSKRKLLSNRRHLSRHPIGDVNLRSKLDSPTKFNEKCQAVDDSKDGKTQTINTDKASLKRLMEEEIPSEQHSNKKIATDKVNRSQSNPKLVDELTINHGKASKSCDRQCQMPVHGWKDAENNEHHQPSHQNVVDRSLNKHNPSASKKVFFKEVHPRNRRSCGCKNINCVEHDQLKEINLQLVQMNEAEETGNQKFTDGKCLSRNGVGHQSKQLLGALEILNSNKELFIELLQDPNSLLVKHIQDLSNSQAKGQQTKSFSGAKLSEYQTSVARQHEQPTCPKRLESSDRYLSKGNGDPQSSDRIVVLKPGLSSLQNSSDRLSPPYSSLQSSYYLRVKEQSDRPTPFSFDHIKRKLKDAMGVNRKEQHWMSSNGKLEKYPYDCQGSDAGDGGISVEIDGSNSPSTDLDIGHKVKSSLGVKTTNKIGKAKDSECSGHEAAATSGNGCRNSNFSIVGHPMRHESEISAMEWKHLSGMLNNGNEDVDLLRKQVPKACGRMSSFPEHGLLPTLNPGRDWELSFATRHMSFSPYSNHQMVYKNKYKFQKEKNKRCLSSLKQNIEPLSFADTEKPNDPLQIFDAKPNISKNNFSGMKIKDDSSPTGETNALEMPFESLSTHQAGPNQSTDGANDCEKIGSLESPREHSPSENQPAKFVPGEFSLSSPSSLQRVEDSENLKDQVEQPSPVSVLEQNFIESNISQPAQLPIEALLVNAEDHYSATLDGPLLGPKININTAKDGHASFSEFISALFGTSGLNWDELSMKFHSSDQLLDRSLFDKLKMPDSQFCGDWMLLFDFINEVLAEICQYNSGCSPWVSCIKPIIGPLPVGKTIIHEVIKRVDWYLLSQSPLQTLKQVFEQDLTRSRTWLDIRNENEDTAIETAEGVLEELLVEIVFELVL